ncbi:unnamed protein product [Macrosiphum euphorbiae]|uniref:Uncharacterized protein n=1 Tax=Macrosiphum euphorbiae TaxID=13131 RepID=A0AAV0XY79_9HEMI|nr:unnamed protein product [Macrosiphum euphorbiae]
MKGLSKDDQFEENDPAVKTDINEDNIIDEEASTACMNEFITDILNGSTIKGGKIKKLKKLWKNVRNSNYVGSLIISHYI